MVGGTGFEPVTPTMSVLDIGFDNTYALNDFNNLAESNLNTVVHLWFARGRDGTENGNRLATTAVWIELPRSVH